jgi:hypothetical protein
MADRNMLVRALVRAAKVQGEASGKKPVEVLTDIITGKFSLDFSDGRTVISTSEAGGTGKNLMDTLPRAAARRLALPLGYCLIVLSGLRFALRVS